MTKKLKKNKKAKLRKADQQADAMTKTAAEDSKSTQVVAMPETVTGLIDEPPANLVPAQIGMRMGSDIQLSTTELVALPADLARQRIDNQLRIGQAKLAQVHKTIEELEKKLREAVEKYTARPDKDSVFTKVIEAGRVFYEVRGLSYHYQVVSGNLDPDTVLRNGCVELSLETYSSQAPKSWGGSHKEDLIQFTQMVSLDEIGCDETLKQLREESAKAAQLQEQMQQWQRKIAELPALTRAARLEITATVLRQMEHGEEMLTKLSNITSAGFFRDVEAFE
jgi:hypothetical protein